LLFLIALLRFFDKTFIELYLLVTETRLELSTCRNSEFGKWFNEFNSGNNKDELSEEFSILLNSFFLLTSPSNEWRNKNIYRILRVLPSVCEHVLAECANGRVEYTSLLNGFTSLFRELESSIIPTLLWLIREKEGTCFSQFCENGVDLELPLSLKLVQDFIFILQNNHFYNKKSLLEALKEQQLFFFSSKQEPVMEETFGTVLISVSSLSESCQIYYTILKIV
jgi:hypothetical protein